MVNGNRSTQTKFHLILVNNFWLEAHSLCMNRIHICEDFILK